MARRLILREYWGMRALLMMTALSLSALAASCGGGATHREPDEYTGCGTDEHWHTFDDNEPLATVGSAMAPALTKPAANATVPATPKVIVQWNQDPADPGMSGGDVVHINGPGCNDCCPQYNLGALTTLHDPPVSGDLYDLQFSVGGNVVWRVVTTLQEWTPTDALWAQWKGKQISLKIYRMALLVNQLKQGPYVAAAPTTFSVAN
jgi:hypothetical protein